MNETSNLVRDVYNVKNVEIDEDQRDKRKYKLLFHLKYLGI